MEFLYPTRKSWTSASGKLDRNISFLALKLDTRIESVWQEGARTTDESAMVTSSSYLASPAKTFVLWNMRNDSSCMTLKPPPVCAALMLFLEYTKEGWYTKDTWQMYSSKDLIPSNIGTRYWVNGSLLDTLLCITKPTTIIKNGSEGLGRSGCWSVARK